MALQSDVAIATRDAGSSRYERIVTLGQHTIGVYYPKPVQFETNDFDSGYSIRSVPLPSTGWEHSLNGAIRRLQDSAQDIGHILTYLPEGTLINYGLNGQNPDKIPIEVGIAKEIVGADLETVIAVVELWLKKRLNGLQ